MQSAILDSVELACGGAVTLYDWMADDVRDGRNLIRTDADGTEIWRAEPTLFGNTGQRDCFARFSWDGLKLIASTSSCYRVAIDIDTGAVATLAFTK